MLEELGHEPVDIAADLRRPSNVRRPLDQALVDSICATGAPVPEIGRGWRERRHVAFVTANPGLLSGFAGAIGVTTKPTDARSSTATVDYALGRRSGTRASGRRRSCA